MGIPLRRSLMLACALAFSLGSGPTAPPPAGPTQAPAASAPSPRPAGPSPAARLGRGDQSSEYWDITAVFDQGHRIFTRFSISNEGPGDRTGFALGQILFPDGHIVPFQNGRLEGRWSLSDDRLRIEMGSSLLDLHGPPYHFEVDKNKKGIKFYLDYDSTGPGRSWRSAPPGYHLDLLTLGAKVSGTIWVRGVVQDPVPVTGRISVTHAFMDESEFELVKRRIEPHGVTSRDGRSHLYAVHALDARSGGEATWLVERTGDVWRETEGFSLTPGGHNDASKKGYPIPSSLVLEGTRVRGRIDVGRRLLQHDPLALAPAPFRWLLSFRAEPSQVWLESSYSLEWLGDSEATVLEGTGVSSFYFLNKLK